MSLTIHQKRVLAALLALERKHDWPWWSRDAIGQVVQAGGYHQTIQRSTMVRLRDAGLVLVEAESWSGETRALVRCGCACHNWGLTEAGRETLEELRIRLSKETLRRIDRCSLDCLDWTERTLTQLNDDDDDEERWLVNHRLR